MNRPSPGSDPDVPEMSLQNVEIAKSIREAIKQGDTAAVGRLLESEKALLEQMTPFGTWLHVAASRGRTDIMRLLVSLGADVNRRGGIGGAAPINEACSEGHLEAARYLVAVGARLDTSDPQRNPLFGAIYGGHASIVEFLIGQGVDLRVSYSGDSMENMDALAFAEERGQTEIAAIIRKALNHS